MTKKKTPNKKKPQRQQNDTPGEFNQFSMEKTMAEITRLLSEQEFESIEEANAFLEQHITLGEPLPDFGFEPETELEEAQEIMYQAFDASSKSARIRLARKALETSMDCADAYVMLAEINAPTAAEKLALYEAAVRAGERALGDEFKHLKGSFWGFIETRPYMRARIGLALTLQDLGKLEEAAAHMEAMLELNPNDNQGVRQVLVSLLLELEDNKRLEKLFKQYPEDWMAHMQYSRALFAFRKSGPGPKANKLLKDAIAHNPFVVDYLTGKKKVPKNFALSYMSPGDESEALDYIEDGLRPWTQTEGAINWVASIAKTVEESDAD